MRAGRKSCRPIRTRITARPDNGRGSPRRADDVQRCLARPPRLTLWQTQSAPRGTAAPAAAVATGSNVTIELLNVQSLLPKLPDIIAELQQRGTATAVADILCFTETNLKAVTPNRFLSLPGYQVFRQDRKLGRKKSGGGVAIYIRDGLHAKRIATPAPPAQSHTESLWLSVKLSERRATTIGCIYRPPSTGAAQVDVDYDDLEEQLQAVIAAHPAQRIGLAGDFNSDAETSPAAHQRLLQLEGVLRPV